MEGFGSEGVGEMDADGGSADGEVDDLPESGVGEVFRRERVVRLGNLLGCSPGGDPVWGGGCGVRLRKRSGCNEE